MPKVGLVTTFTACMSSFASMKYNSLVPLLQRGDDPPAVETCHLPDCTSGKGRTKTSKRPVSSDVYASHFPSGDSAALRSRNEFANSGTGALSIPGLNPRTLQHTASAERRTNHLPSADSNPSPSPRASAATRCAGTLPSARWRYSAGSPFRSEMKNTSRPSADQVGRSLFAPSKVSRDNARPPVSFLIQMLGAFVFDLPLMNST